MPKVKGLSRSQWRLSNSATLHVFDDLTSHHAVIPEHHEQHEQHHEEQHHEQQHHEEQVRYRISSSSSSLLDQQQQEENQHQQQDSCPRFENKHRVSFEDSFPSQSSSPSSQDDVTSIFLNSEYATQTQPQHHHHKQRPSHLINTLKISTAMTSQRGSLSKLSRSKLSRSGCLSSLVDQAVSEPTAVNSVSEDNLLGIMGDDCGRDIPTNDQRRSLSHASLELHSMEDYDGTTDNSDGGCSGWGQFVDVIPLEPSTKQCRTRNSSHAAMRYCPYSTVSQRNRRPRSFSSNDSVISDDGDQPRIDWSTTDAGVTSLRHSASTTGLSSALYNVQI